MTDGPESTSGPGAPEEEQGDPGDAWPLGLGALVLSSCAFLLQAFVGFTVMAVNLTTDTTIGPGSLFVLGSLAGVALLHGLALRLSVVALRREGPGGALGALGFVAAALGLVLLMTALVNPIRSALS